MFERERGTEGIYAIRNTVNGFRYIGRSFHIERRITEHMYLLDKKARQPDGDADPFVRDWIKYGPEAFEVDILEIIPDDRNEQERRERWYILNTPCQYNKAVRLAAERRRQPLKINYPPEKTETEAVS